jgi:DNA-binding MarR family transcriptional regulator
MQAPGAVLAAGLEDRVSRLWWLISRDAPTVLSRSAAATLARLREDGPQRISALAHGESVAQPSMTQLVQRLERDAYVTRHPDPDDARATLIEITAAGHHALEARAGVRAEALAARLEALSTRERAAIAKALPALDALLDA